MPNSLINQNNVNALVDRCRQDVDNGLLPSCQVALGFRGELILDETIGNASADSRYCFFSATKPFVAAAMWQLLTEGLVSLDTTIASYLTAFEENEKNKITLEQVLLHTAGFPHAPMGPRHWTTSSSRRKRMAEWTLNWKPDTRFEYHATSAHWVLAEIINEVTGNDYRDEIHQRVTSPLGIPRILGIPLNDQEGIVDLQLAPGDATPDELEAAFGVRELPPSEVNDNTIINFNRPETKEIGVPGGGGFGRAHDLAMFYQGLLHNPEELWEPVILQDAISTVRNNLKDPMGVPAHRALGVIIAGNDGMTNRRGLGRSISPSGFGHNGVGGQLAWADPHSGLSFGYVTNGLDRHQIRQPRRGTALASLAAVCTTN